MRPLPRLHAVTTHRVLALPDFRVRVAAIVSAGPAVALHVRDKLTCDRDLYQTAERLLAHARPPEASIFVNGRPDMAGALRAQGLQLGVRDLSPRQARATFATGWIGASVHDETEARRAIDEGADYLVAGSIFRTVTHPDQSPAGLDLIYRLVGLGLPVIAIGGITPDRVDSVFRAGAYGVAAVSALWQTRDSGAAALSLLEPWMQADD